MLNYNHLYYFHVAAAEGSLSAAAVKLGVKQSTVSEQLRSLERALGTTLFERSSTGMRLTPSGQIAYEHTTAMFRAGDRLVQALVGDRREPPRSLRIGISGPVARATSTDFLLPVFQIEACMPTISTGETLDMIRQLRANDLDLVLCEVEPPEATAEGLQHTVIEHIPLVAIIGQIADPGPDWQNVGLIQYRASSMLHWEVESYLEEHGLKPQIVGEADDPLLLVEAAARGGYVVIVPRSSARDAVTSGRVRILAQLASVRAGVHALYQDGVSAELARRVIERLIDAARANVE
ncbi:MAG TPA: LysR family transcriptional regulator [Kofleriaceae bacterium]|nr:LysR family transcriptional regulator [Kofleriaceae bacterium]